jgi:two-component system, OmpR family, response regulator
MAEILLVEDDPILGRGLHVSLDVEGHQVHWARDLKTAEQISRVQKLDLVVLDLGLPDGSGITFLKKIREEGLDTPVIILTAKTDEETVVEGLTSGACDYVRKPFGKKELSARIKVALKESLKRDRQVRYCDLTLFTDQRRIVFNEHLIELKRREYDVLSYFIQHADTVVTREDLIRAFDKDSEMFDRTIDSHVSHVRSKLRKAGVESVRITSLYGVGYRLEKK